MSFFSNVTPRTRPRPIAEVITREPAPVAKEHIYSELIAQRPALLDEKLKLHERIIDEFNLVSLEKLPREGVEENWTRAVVWLGDRGRRAAKKGKHRKGRECRVPFHENQS